MHHCVIAAGTETGTTAQVKDWWPCLPLFSLSVCVLVRYSVLLSNKVQWVALQKIVVIVVCGRL